MAVWRIEENEEENICRIRQPHKEKYSEKEEEGCSLFRFRRRRNDCLLRLSKRARIADVVVLSKSRYPFQIKGKV